MATNLHPKRVANDKASRPKRQTKEYDALIKAAWKAGWWCVRGRSNYIKCYDPAKKEVVNVPSTPGRNARRHIVREQFRDLGLDV